MEIRTIRPEEHDALGELTVRVYEAIGATDDDYTPELRDVAARAAAAEVLVAVDGDRVLGGVTYVSRPGPFAHRAGPDECEMRMLAVDPEFRRRGIGNALVRACIERARADRRSAMVLLTETFMVEAQRIYERLGFVRTPDRDWQYAADVLLIAFVLTIHHPPTTRGHD